MKILRLLLKFVVLPIIALTLGSLLFFTVNNRLYLGGEDAAYVAYLNKNKATLDRKNATFDSFDSDFYNNNIFILSENHGFEDVQLIDDQLFMHLNQKADVHFYIAEMDSLRASQLNQFLRKPTADESLLKAITKDIALRIPQQSSQQLYEKWLRLYRYNAGLADSAKIEVLGLDQNFDDKTAKLGRDSSMFLNFKAIVEKRGLQNEKFYGLFGYFHGMQSGTTEHDIYPFAAKLKRNGTFPQFQKIQTIACLPVESEMFVPPFEGMPSPPDQKTGQFNMDGPVTLAKGINDLKATTQPNSMTIFHLNNSNSPYKSSQNLAGIKVNLLGDEVLPNNNKQTTTDFLQHVILLRGSQALRPLQ